MTAGRPGRLKVLLGHVVHSPGLSEWYAAIAAAAGEPLDVRCFCVTLDPPAKRLSWRELDRRWRARDPELFGLYRRLQEAASDCDVFLLYNGANVHPEFLGCLRTFNVYCCFDDPESSGDLSAPVASAFDAVFYGNIAARYQYDSWGCRRLAWLPVFTAPGDVPTRAQGEVLLAAGRPVDIALACEKNGYREGRLSALAEAFPQARCLGRGWPSGYVGETALKELYRSARIGWNVHNSTGPINRRVFALPAFGVLQLCDNKTGLGQIFRLDGEAVGFDTIPEAIEKTRHYLAREDERREVAAAGWRRYWSDYHAGAIWRRIAGQLEAWTGEQGARKQTPAAPLPGKTARGAAGVRLRLARAKAGRLREAARDLLRGWGPEAESSPAGAGPTVRDERVYLGVPVPAYRENPGMAGVNLARERLSRGEPFEWPNMLALNWAVTALIREARSIVEIGSGTGPFASFAAVDSGRIIHCFEEDDFAREWAARHRAFPNVAYFNEYEGNLLPRYDLLVAVDVIEHAADLRGFLSFCAGLAPRAVLTTPNREAVRGPADQGPPPYPPHVREFDAGEFYWILKHHYRDVSLYHMPDVYVPWLEPMGVAVRGTPIVAECRDPREGPGAFGPLRRG